MWTIWTSTRFLSTHTYTHTHSHTVMGFISKLHSRNNQMFQEHDGDAVFFRGLGFVAPPLYSSALFLTIIISNCFSSQFSIASLSHVLSVYLSVWLYIISTCLFLGVTVTQKEQRSERACGHRKDGGMISRVRKVGRERQCEV